MKKIRYGDEQIMRILGKADQGQISDERASRKPTRIINAWFD